MMEEKEEAGDFMDQGNKSETSASIMMEDDEDTRDFCKVDSGTGNPAHYLADVFQEDRLFAIISALLDSGAAVNILSSSKADSIGLERRAPSTEDFNLRVAK